jgi:hypothetical protein
MDAVTEARFKEYDTLREEVLQSITHRTQIISFGFGAIATFATGTLLVKLPEHEPSLALVVFSAVIPIMSVVFLLLWFSELSRMFRASNHLVGLEQRINEDLKAEALTWESGLVVNDRRHRWYFLVIFLFGAIAAFAPLVGVAITDPIWWARVWVWVPQPVISLCMGSLIARWARLERRGDRSGHGRSA